MTRPVRVLHVLSSLGVGGAETWLMEVLRLWAKTGSGEMDFLLTSGKPDFFDAEAAGLGASLHYLPYGRAYLRQFLPSYRDLLRRGRYDAIHDHADYAGGWRFLMGAGLLPRVRVSHVHNPWSHISVNYGVGPARRLAAESGKALVQRFASHVCGTSSVVLRKYGFEPGRVGPPKIEVVHCGLDIRKFNTPRESDRVRILDEFGWPSQAKLVLFAGRLDRALELNHPENHKNSWLALNIVKEALARDPSVRFIMAGAGESRGALEKQVGSWGLAGEVQLTGIRDDIAALMRAADILLFPSADEGLGMAAVEAQAAGLPVLASTAVPREAIVIPDMVRFMPLSEQIDRWAVTLLGMLAAPRLPADKCRSLLEASAFSIENSARNLLRIYRDTCRAESGAA